MVTTRPPDPTGYGRIVRDRVNGAAGRVLRVVEQKDATPDERAIDEVNAGIYCFAWSFLLREIGRLRAENAQRELYLTDLVAVASREAVVATVEAEATEVAGINDRAELAAAEAELRRRINRAHMSAGVTLRDPATTTIEASVEIERDSEIGAGVVLRGATRIGEGCVVDIGCVLCDCIVERGARLKPYCVASESRIGEGAQVGPFAHLRPGSELGAEVHVGNFVETKKARLGRGSKANHLSYLGDTEIGSRANIGAGTITCNYDGRLKHRTVIEEGAFIGSDTQLVAPVRVGSGAYVGSGTTVTRDVPAGALALSRVEQRNVEGWVERKKRGE
jgi:bifunctional UDP-N-acetylglucosamine pyrophosphorylase/glucosamine-1-phosphate N-acetyltransferase